MVHAALAKLTRWTTLLLLAAVWFGPGAGANEAARQDLKRFFDTVTAFQARFQQTLLDEDGEVLERSDGEMWIVRPGRFRWNYAPPVEQELVSDGTRVWIYDADLEQVTVRAIDNTLGRTPAILLAGQTDLEEQFTIEPTAEDEADAEANMLVLTPKAEDAQFTKVKIGFIDQVLSVLEFTDSLGQITQIELIEGVENPLLNPDLFSFKVPQGVDVVDETTD